MFQKRKKKVKTKRIKGGVISFFILLRRLVAFASEWWRIITREYRDWDDGSSGDGGGDGGVVVATRVHIPVRGQPPPILCFFSSTRLSRVGVNKRPTMAVWILSQLLVVFFCFPFIYFRLAFFNFFFKFLFLFSHLVFSSFFIIAIIMIIVLGRLTCDCQGLSRLRTKEKVTKVFCIKKWNEQTWADGSAAQLLRGGPWTSLAIELAGK